MKKNSKNNFCIYGVLLSSQEILKRIKDEYKNLIVEDDEYETLDHLFSNKSGWIYDDPFGSGDYYIGLSMTEIEDNETGKQFKEKVKNTVQQYFEIKDNKFHIYQETYFE